MMHGLRTLLLNSNAYTKKFEFAKSLLPPKYGGPNREISSNHLWLSRRDSKLEADRFCDEIAKSRKIVRQCNAAL